jgi:apolipoprotein D and lipocalin family protein
MKPITLVLSLLPVLGLSACHGTHPPMKTVGHVELERFMGDWYVIAAIPTFLERNAFDAVESYRLLANGRIATTFTFREGGFDGEKKVYHPTGFVRDRDSNAVWGMQFIWPIKADYRVVYLDENYTRTVIGREKRDYVWIMARTPRIPDKDYAMLTRFVADLGYDIDKLRKVPQRDDRPQAGGGTQPEQGQ